MREKWQWFYPLLEKEVWTNKISTFSFNLNLSFDETSFDNDRPFPFRVKYSCEDRGDWTDTIIRIIWFSVKHYSYFNWKSRRVQVLQNDHANA